MGTLDIRQPEFWDSAAVDKELRRVYDICGGCRRCLPLCPSFKVLFDRMDVEAVDGDVDKLPGADVKEVVDLCYQCKLCFNHCPYTPPHRWEVDFPRLMLRARAAQVRRDGVTLQDRMLGNVDLVGRLGSLAAPLSNWMNELRVHRAFIQAVAGIHRDRNLPKFHRRPFSSWFKSRPAASKPAAPPVSREAKPPKKVALFHTCTVEYNEPAIGRAAVRVLERNRVDVRVPPQRCCGMPYLDGGAVDQAKALIRDNVKSLAPAVREGCEIVVPGPTCSYMLKQEYPWLDGSEDAKLVAANTRDLFEYLARLQTTGELDTNFSRPVGAVTYHVPCHLRAQNIGHKSADVLGAIPGASVSVVEKCSAVDGTWGFKTEYYELSLKVAKPLFDAIAGGAPTAATDCPLAALQIEQGTGKKPKHPIEVLALPTDSRSDGVKLLKTSEILNLVEYEKVRDARRRRIVELKKARRIAVGRYLTFVFENRDTVWFQIQEMVRAERIVDDVKIAEEIEVYNALLPQAGELSATLMIEIEDAAQIKPVLDKLLGIDTRGYVKLMVGSRLIPGDFEAGRSDEERGKLSAVHFVRFALPPEAHASFATSEVALVVEHPNERALTVLSDETKRSLLDDLT